MFDVAIIGAGITGAAIARELSRLDVRLIILEKDSDAANGSTKANSAIVHAGFDPAPGTLKARFNVEGNRLFPGLCRECDVPFRQNGSLVIAFSEEECATLEELLEQGRSFGVPGLEIVGREKLHRMETGLSQTARAALYAPSAGITDPYGLAIALVENAVENGAAIRLNSPVTAIRPKGDGFQIETATGPLEAARVINAAGLYADRISEMVEKKGFQIKPVRGEYFLLDKETGPLVNHVLFPCPTALGKGVLISPTAHGNLIVGPNSVPTDSPEATETTAGGLAQVRENALKIMPELPLQRVITSFSGLRAKTDRGDFIVGESPEAEGFFNAAGIESPGLVSAPAIALYLADLVRRSLGNPPAKKYFQSSTRSHRPFLSRPEAEQKRLLAADPRYGRVICRCEHVTEGEIVEAIHGPVGARTLDGIKKRLRPGGGRCQGGFCGPRVMQILARELGRELPAIEKDNPGSFVLTGPTKGKLAQVQEPAGNGSGSSQPGRDRYSLVVIGGGPAGMAAAVEAHDCGVKDILLIERDHELGGILQQCIHNGFGLHRFREELTGPEYAERYSDMIRERQISCLLDTMVLSVGADRRLTYLNSREGPVSIHAGAIILAMGCRERTRGAVNIPGTRPAGIFSAGTAQRLVNIEGYLVGRKVVVFGSGDIGLIMARRMVLEGAEVVAVVERKDYSEGLVRNYVQCIEDYGIPMLLRHTITDIKGRQRVEGITIAATDSNKNPVPGTERDLDCDTVLFSRGLIPENELSREAGITIDPVTGGPAVNEAMETSVSGIFACGNVVHVHDLVDWVSEESVRAGRGAVNFLQQPAATTPVFTTRAREGVSYVVPQQARRPLDGNGLDLYLRVRGQHQDAALEVRAGQHLVKAVKKKVLTPGEMTVIKVKENELPSNDFTELSVRVVEGGDPACKKDQ